MYHSIKTWASSTKLDVSPFIFVYREGLLCVWGMYGLYIYSIHVKCILMQWPKGNKEPPFEGKLLIFPHLCTGDP